MIYVEPIACEALSVAGEDQAELLERLPIQLGETTESHHELAGEPPVQITTEPNGYTLVTLEL